MNFGLQSSVLNVHSSCLESCRCSLVPVSQTLWTSSQPTWRSWQRWSPQLSFIPSSVTPLPTAAARVQYACVTWDRLHSVTNTANVSTISTRVHHGEKSQHLLMLSFFLFYSISSCPDSPSKSPPLILSSHQHMRQTQAWLFKFFSQCNCY